MGSKRNARVNVLIEKLDQATRKIGDDDIILSAATEHLKVFAFYLSKGDDETLSQEEVNNVLLSKLFFDKIHTLIPKKRFTCQVDENSGWMIPLLPLELFGKAKLNEGFRTNLFFECLEVADILDCRVSSVLATHCLLKVIHKYGSMRILEDLNITVVLQADQNEMSLLPKGGLLKYELLRVAVKNIEKTESETKVSVTLSDSILQFKKNKAKLGKISEGDLPSYVLDPPDVSQFKSYTEYLNSLPGFQNYILFQEMTPKFGIDPCRIYSFFPKFECMQCPEDFTGEALLKTAKRSDLAELLESAAEFYKVKRFKHALRKLEVAVELDPKCIDIYILRARIYTDYEKTRCSKNVTMNWVKAFSLDPNNTYVKEQMSYLIFAVANKYYREKMYKEASECAKKAQNLNPSNSEANELLNYLKNKHPEAYLDLESVSLYELQNQKSKLMTELQEEFKKIGDYKLVRIKAEKT